MHAHENVHTVPSGNNGTLWDRARSLVTGAEGSMQRQDGDTQLVVSVGTGMFHSVESSWEVRRRVSSAVASARGQEQGIN